MMDIIEIAKEYAVAQQVAELETAYYTFTEPDLREFAQRIEQPLREQICKISNAAYDHLNAKDKHIDDLKQRIAELEITLQKQAKAALSGMDSARASGAAMLKVATEMQNQLKPELLDSERQANAVLTEENETLRKQIEQLREALRKAANQLTESGWNCGNLFEDIDKAMEQTK